MNNNIKNMCLSCGFFVKNTSNLKIRKSKCSNCPKTETQVEKKYNLYYMCPRCGNNLNFIRPPKN